MCGRFTLNKTARQLIEELPGFEIDEKVQPRFNIAPNQPLLAILNDGMNMTTFLQWGLIPPWAKDPSVGSRMINARAETLAEKPSFKQPFKRKRCLIPADGYYEWTPVSAGRKKQPWYFRPPDGRVFAFAGLWEEWHDREGGLLMTATIITTAPNRLVARVHHRMPVILQPGDYEMWLSREEDRPDRLSKVLQPCSDSFLESFPVSTLVNRVAVDRPECIQPLEGGGLEQPELF